MKAMMLIILCAGLTTAVMAEQKITEKAQQDAYRALNKQLVMPLNTKVLGTNMLSRRMPSTFYRAEVASVQPDARMIHFVLHFYNNERLELVAGGAKNGAPAQARLVHDRKETVAKGVYDPAHKLIWIESNGTRLTPEAYIKRVQALKTT